MNAINKIKKLNLTDYIVDGIDGIFSPSLRSGPFQKLFFYPPNNKARMLVCNIFISYGDEVNADWESQFMDGIIEFCKMNNI